MSKLYFYYSAMNAGKTTTLLQSAYNYHERGMRTLILTPTLDNRYGEGMVASRIGLKARALRLPTLPTCSPWSRPTWPNAAGSTACWSTRRSS